MKGWKIFTHDRRSPIQGGPPVWDGTYPYDLPEVELDRSSAECAPGWNFTSDIETGFRIAGMWPTDWPSVVVRVEAEDAIQRGDKYRATTLHLLRDATEKEIEASIYRMSSVFGKHADVMADAQIQWRQALARPNHDEAKVEHGLRKALAVRGLDWYVMQYKGARDVWDAKDAWDAEDTAWDAWVAWTTRDVWDAWDAWVAWNAGDARNALTVMFASLMGWLDIPRDYLSTGVIDAYRNGTHTIFEAGPSELGYSMVKQ